MNKFCFGNWKLNKDLNETKGFIEKLNDLVSADQSQSFAVFPPALVASAFSEQTHIKWGGQNIYSKNSGAFTGENSASVLKSMGATYALIGHSERRSLFHETNEDVLAKTIAALENQLTPVVCIGESLEEREAGKVSEVLDEQISEGLKGIDFSSVIIAYEPVWAIGTGKTATPKEVEEVHTWLRESVGNDKTPLLYGGSVKPANAQDLFSIKDVNGFLIGGASLEPESLYQIYENMKA